MRFNMPVPPQVLAGLDEVFKSGSLSTIPQLMVEVDVSGAAEIKTNLNILRRDMVGAAVEEARRAAEWLKQRSQELVPYDSGDLHDSAFIHEDDDHEYFRGFSVGYDALSVQYAWYVHEIPARNYTKPGTKDHFLSDPADELRGEFPDTMRQGLMDAISKSAALRSRAAGPRLVKKR